MKKYIFAITLIGITLIPSLNSMSASSLHSQSGLDDDRTTANFLQLNQKEVNEAEHIFQKDFDDAVSKSSQVWEEISAAEVVARILEKNLLDKDIAWLQRLYAKKRELLDRNPAKVRGIEREFNRRLNQYLDKQNAVYQLINCNLIHDPKAYTFRLETPFGVISMYE